MRQTLRVMPAHRARTPSPRFVLAGFENDGAVRDRSGGGITDLVLVDVISAACSLSSNFEPDQARLTMKTIPAISFVLALLFATAAGCSDDPPPNIGETCTSTTGCDEGLQCNTTVPGGYCTTSCTTAGATDQCPEDSVCDAIAGTAVTCVKICKTADDCRSDQDCNGVSGSSIKACKPKP